MVIDLLWLLRFICLTQSPGEYAVVHSMLPSLSQQIPHHIKRSAPSGAVIHDVELSYDFNLAQRSSEPTRFQFTMSTVAGAYNALVVNRPNNPDWASLVRPFRNQPGQTLSQSFSQLLVSELGSNDGCQGKYNNDHMIMQEHGTVSVNVAANIILSGTLAPFKIENAVVAFDANFANEVSISRSLFSPFRVKQWPLRCDSGHLRDSFRSSLSRTRKAMLTPKLTPDCYEH